MSSLQVEVVPGVIFSIASDYILGTPIMHDYVSASLSDLLTDWELIRTRLDYAARGDILNGQD